jgi:hypothetical protein
VPRGVPQYYRLVQDRDCRRSQDVHLRPEGQTLRWSPRRGWTLWRRLHRPGRTVRADAGPQPDHRRDSGQVCLPEADRSDLQPRSGNRRLRRRLPEGHRQVRVGSDDRPMRLSDGHPAMPGHGIWNLRYHRYPMSHRRGLSEGCDVYSVYACVWWGVPADRTGLPWGCNNRKVQL